MRDFHFHFVPMKLISIAEKLEKHKSNNKTETVHSTREIVEFCKKINEMQTKDALKYQSSYSSSFIKRCLQYAYENPNLIISENIHAILQKRYRRSWWDLYYFALLQTYDDPVFRQYNNKKEEGDFQQYAVLINLLHKNLDDLPARLVKDIDPRKEITLDRFAEKYAIEKEMRLYIELKKQLLLTGNRYQLEQFGLEEIFMMIRTEKMKTSALVTNNLFNHYKMSELGTEYLLDIADSHKYPKDNRATDFWRYIDEKNQDRFAAFLNKERIQRIFGYDERSHFWGQYAHYMDLVEESTENQLLVMHVGQYVIIEFTKVGNAAYIYSKDYYRQHYMKLIQRNRAIPPTRLKTRMMVSGLPPSNRFDGNNFIIHSGSWWMNALHFLVAMGVNPNEKRPDD